VTRDEPNNSGGGGNTSDDIEIATASNRCNCDLGGRERHGRPYTIKFEITDASSNVAAATGEVTVPKSRNGSPAIVDVLLLPAGLTLSPNGIRNSLEHRSLFIRNLVTETQDAA
jgi:hypothetical protein